VYGVLGVIAGSNTSAGVWTYTNTTDCIAANTGSLQTLGGMYIAKGLLVNGAATVGVGAQAGTPYGLTVFNNGNQNIDRGVSIGLVSPGAGLGTAGSRVTAKIVSASLSSTTQGGYLAFYTENTSGVLTEWARISAVGILSASSISANSVSQTVQNVAVSTTPTVNLALGNTVILGSAGVPGALTAATTITFQNPTIGSTTTLSFKQFTSSVAVTFTIAGYTFYQNGKTAGVASGNPVLLAADMTLSTYVTVDITWLSATTAMVALVKS
jgi:hypothetical protein